MDRRFLKEVTKGYITNHDVYSEYTPKEVDLIEKTIYEDLCDLTTEIRVVDEDMYNRVYFSNRLEQYSILENYLNIRYQKEDESKIIQEDDILDEGWKTNIGLTATAAGLWKAWSAGLISKLGITGLISKLGPILLGFFSSAPVILSLFLATALFYHFNMAWINKKFFGSLSSFGIILDSFGKSIKTHGKYYQFRYAITQKNFDKCYQKCGVKSLKDLNAYDFLNKHIDDKKKSESIASCLAECFVTTTMERINISLSMYLNCLKSTKEFDKVSNLKGPDFFQFVKSESFVKYGFNTNSLCNEYLNEVSTMINGFDDLLNYVYKNESAKRQILNRLMVDMNKTITEESKDRNVIQKQVYPQKFKNRK
jgi:hypothetical protein